MNAKATRTTIYSLKKTENLKSCISQKYHSDKFVLSQVSIRDTDGLQITGNFETPETTWSPILSQYTGTRVTLGNNLAAAVLLIPRQDRVFALCYGKGYLMLEQSLIDPRFGIRFAVRVLNPKNIQQVTRYVLDARGKINYNSVANGENVRHFGIEEYGEIINCLVGKTGEVKLTVNRNKKNQIKIKSSDSLSLPLANTTENLFSDLDEIERIMSLTDIKSEFEFIEYMQPLKKNKSLIKKLEKKLFEKFINDNVSTISLLFPYGNINKYDEVQKISVNIPKHKTTFYDDLNIDIFLNLIQKIPKNELIATLKKTTIQYYEDEQMGTPYGCKIPFIKLLTAEVQFDDARYFLVLGKWYEIEKKYQDHLINKTEIIFSQPSNVKLPYWSSNKNEAEYNCEVGQLENFTCLDRKLIYTEMHPRGIECCDLLGPDNELIHVKRANGSKEMSHLLAQGEVSLNSLMMDFNARTKLAKLVLQFRPNKPLPKEWLPKKIVFAVDLGRNLDAHNFFTFTRILLIQCVERLQRQNIEVSFVSIYDNR